MFANAAAACSAAGRSAPPHSTAASATIQPACCTASCAEDVRTRTRWLERRQRSLAAFSYAVWLLGHGPLCEVVGLMGGLP